MIENASVSSSGRPSTGAGSSVSSSSPGHQAIRRWRVGLIVGGLLLLVIGGLVLLADVAPSNYIGIAVWFLGALIIHDGLIAAAVVGVQVGMRKTGRRIPLAVIAILQGSIVVGAIMALIVFPEIYKTGIGVKNPSVLPLDYGANLIGFYVVLIVVTALAVAGYLFARRQKSRSSSRQA